MKELFDEILKTFENENIKEFAKKVIDAAPTYFFEVPASSSLKYHPSYACTTPLGLAKHTVALVRILNHVFEIESIANQFTSEERDFLRVAGIAHDMMKSGTQEDYEHNHYTKFDHPLLAARMIMKINGLSYDEKAMIGNIIASHMGAWCSDKRHPDIVLPKPESKYQILLHMCDYLASRKDIEIKFDSMSPVEEQIKPDINTWRFTFGKHNGKTIQEVYNEDPGYIKWAKENMDREPAKSLLKEFRA